MAENDCTGIIHFTPSSLDDLKQISLNAAMNGWRKLILRKRRNRIIIATSQKPTDTTQRKSAFFVNVKNFNRIIEIDVTAKQVTVEGSISIGKLNACLKKVGLALSMYGLSDDVTIARALSLGSYTSSVTRGTIASYVKSIEMLTSDCKIVKCSPNERGELFRAINCGFGSCGIVLTITLQCESLYHVQTQHFGCSLNQLLRNLPYCVKNTEYFHFSWFPHTNNVVVYKAEKIREPEVPPSGRVSSCFRWITDVALGTHLLLFAYWICIIFPFLLPAVHFLIFWLCFVWDQREFCSPSKCLDPLVRYHNTIEWVVPMDRASRALMRVKKWCDTSAHFLHFPVLVQMLPKDDVFLSPANGTEICSITIGVVRPYNFYFPYERAFSEFSDVMRRIGGRPRLTKELINSDVTQLQSFYPFYSQWIEVRNEFDGANMFANN